MNFWNLIFPANRFKTSRVAGFFTAIGLTVTFTLAVSSQDAAPDSVPTAQQKFDRAVADLRASVKETKRTGATYYHQPAAESEHWKQEWEKSAAAGKIAAAKLKDAAWELLQQESQPNDDLIVIGQQLLHEALSKYQYQQAREISERLIELRPDDSEIRLAHTRTALLTNHFAEVAQALKEANVSLEKMLPAEMALFRQVETLASGFEREQKFRAKEASDDDLPRVELETTQGKIVVELFEDQAPLAVANFVRLVEDKFYEDVFFHQVAKDFLGLSVAQGGVFSMRGPQTLDYTIPDESNVDNARDHFRGVISMAGIQGRPNSASSQFFLTFVPLPQLNGRFTVFGRVISDMKIVDALTATISIDKDGKQTPLPDVIPDRIISARVLRKRDHDYQPTAFKQD